LLTPRIEKIAEDFRGSSWSLLLPDGTEGVLIHTHKGVYRGGHSHSKPEVSLLLSGRMKYKKTLDRKHDVEFIQEAGQILYNGADQPHLAYALEEGWLFDWKLGAKKGETVTTNYPPYRKKVDEQRR